VGNLSMSLRHNITLLRVGIGMLEVEIQPFLTALDITYQLWRIQKGSNEIHKWLTTDSPVVKCKRLRLDFGVTLFTELEKK